MSHATTAAPAALKLSHILVPIDFSDRCRVAAECAESLARRFRADLILLHAVTPLGLPFGAADALAYSGAADLTMERVAERATALEDLGNTAFHGVAAARVVVQSDPAAAIVDYASGHPCDLIVMPTHGYGALHRLIAGSVTAEVIHRARRPVWTGPHIELPPSFRNVLCALDLASDSSAVLEWAAGFAAATGAPLRIVHAIPLSTVRSGGLYFDADWRAHVAQEARERIAKLQHILGFTAETHIAIGDIPDAVVTTAHEFAADLVVIGRGPKAYSIIRLSPCPVVAV